MGKMSEIAAKSVAKMSWTRGKEKIEFDDLITRYGGIVTINGAYIAEMNGNTFPVFTFEEDDKCCFGGGKALKNILDDWLEVCGDIENVDKGLREDPVRIRVGELITTKRGQPFRPVEVLKNTIVDPDTGEILEG